MSFLKYPAYKDSGVEWLGMFPIHWTVTLLKRGYEVVLGKMLQPDSKNEDDEFLPYLRAANIQSAGVDARDVRAMWFSPSEKKSLRLLKGDLLVSEGGDVGRSALWDSDQECYFQNAINRIRSLGSNSTRYLFYWMVSIKKSGYIDVVCNKSTIAHFTAEKVAATPTPFPPPAEQVKIAQFLNHESAKIDTLIEEQQRLIELLKEKRQAVISHAVTKGLDPNVPMKDSGVEWLGKMPAHWAVSKLKFMTDRVVDCPHETPVYDPDGDYLVIRTADLDQGVLKPEGMYRLQHGEYLNRTRRSSLIKNDVVYGREGERWGHAALVPESDLFALGQRMMQFRVGAHVCPEFFMYQLNSVPVYRQGEVDTVGATAPHVNISTIVNYQMMVPPLTEQLQMSLHLSKALHVLDSLIAESIGMAELLRERRSALISAAVTGKIDVRSWQARAAPQTENQTEAALG
ncbi:restriction endonuclease subunit S [Paralcaligenes ureilyticus]|uniref:Type I restriction enzyme S subunit n=1 Tax=Paralcaligenes ureilyticus TaxID=627131 RepID=A0A4R3MGX7_9BURK|nr:restriction endonuclease subunit S [Paralcaligenes ureilyticus]TCT10905.1 type I restriction enzyme S subunit [Paralcaligenes ureilyticus]